MKGIEHLAEEEPVAEESLTCEFVPVFLVCVTSGLNISLSNAGPGRSVKYSKNFYGLSPVYENAS
jgi:hypothetical protein